MCICFFISSVACLKDERSSWDAPDACSAPAAICWAVFWSSSTAAAASDTPDASSAEAAAILSAICCCLA